jgi:hypothetical protein
MLKIKDNVDLEMLKDFGFEISQTLKEEPTELYDGKDTFIELYDDIDDIWNTREICVIGSAYLDTVYDLIQAGLVEKV